MNTFLGLADDKLSKTDVKNLAGIALHTSGEGLQIPDIRIFSNQVLVSVYMTICLVMLNQWMLYYICPKFRSQAPSTNPVNVAVNQINLTFQLAGDYRLVLVFPWLLHHVGSGMTTRAFLNSSLSLLFNFIVIIKTTIPLNLIGSLNSILP